MPSLSLTTPTIDLDQINQQFSDTTEPAQIMQWAAETFGDGLAMTSSFGVQSAVLLHLATQVVPNIPVIVIDTGYLFPETYRFINDLTQQLNLNLKMFTPRLTAAHQEAMFGKLWEQGEEGLVKYHQINKVEPMQRAIRELKVTAWIAGLRREQTDHRKSLRYVEKDNRDSGPYKVHPIINWTRRDVHQYLTKHKLPYHPLWHEGYASIGDWHSSRPITAGEHERAGRFGGLKQECGLHLPTTKQENQSRESSGL